MSYYDPMRYQQQQIELQRSIMNLEDKLRKREREFRSPQFYPNYAERYIPYEREIVGFDGYSRFGGSGGYGYRYSSAFDGENCQNNYLRQLDQIRREEQEFHQSSLRKYSYQYDQHPRVEKFSNASKSQLYGYAQPQSQPYADVYAQPQSQPYADIYSQPHFQPAEEQDSLLVNKYQDGSKARQYNRELEEQRHHLDQNGSGARTERKYEGSQNKFHTAGKQFQMRSPYDMLNQNQSDSKHATSQFKKGDFVAKSPVTQNLTDKFNNAPQLIFENIPNQRKQKQEIQMTPKQKIDRIQPQKVGQRSNSPSPMKAKSSYKKLQKKTNSSMSNIRRMPHNKSDIKYSRLQKSRSMMQTMQVCALKKIQNRLKLSTVIYEDSQFRNIKHEISHLTMTYQNQVKFRNEVKEKINNHPYILKKHAMVIN